MRSKLIARRSFIKTGLIFVPTYSVFARRWVPKIAAAGGGGATNFVFSANATGTNDSGIASVTMTVPAGGLVVLWHKWEGSGSISSISDGTSSLSSGTKKDHANGDMHGQFWYLLVGNSGSKTFTPTGSGSVSFGRCRAACFTYGGTASLDVQNQGTGTSTALNSGNITTTGTLEVVLGGYAEYSGEFVDTGDGSPKINAVTATGIPTTAPSADPTTWAWYRILTATFAGGASTATLTGSREWVGNVISFKTT
jgi:hypothetical protein